MTVISADREIAVDFVIIGGGAAGCIVAARLAEYGFETLLITSGSNDTANPLMREQSLFNQLRQTSYFKHHLPTTPSRNLNNRRMDITVWNTLGGSGVNGGGMERLMAIDWNYFVNATGDQSFQYENMLKYYKMMENYQSTATNGASELHGNNGPIKITQIRDGVFDNVWRKVADELNETFSNDLASTIDYGFSFEPVAFTNGSRSWSGDAYLTPATIKYPNLKVLTGATAIKLDVNEISKQVNNVLFVNSSGSFRAVARKEYILSAGTFYSPHLLMLSGIGDPVILQQNQILVKHESKQVGKNLIDNGLLIVQYDTEGFPINQSVPVALINTQSRTTETTKPDIFLILKTDYTTKHLFVLIFNASPRSMIGSISLYNSNPLMPPNITIDYLEDQTDLKTFIDGINYVRRVMSTNAITQFAQMNEVFPGKEQTDLTTYIRNSLASAYHFLGTCSMGQNAENSVVDSRFKVHGMTNLRVVDASVFPAGFASRTGPCLTVYALAEKAADILREKYS